MRVLPPRTAPPATPTERAHRPPARGYPTYRNCLRWEFGFTCAFCLLHERDLDEFGLGKTGSFWIEHLVPQSHDPGRADDYANCYWSCRYCNSARHDAPNIDPIAQRRLLDPCRDAWSRHFLLDEDRLLPRPHDGDAEYTHEVYRLDAEPKTRARARRNDSLRRAVECLRVGRPVLARVLEDARTASRDDGMRAAELAGIVGAALAGAREIVERFAPIPPKAPTECRCGPSVELRLPAWFEDQVREIP